MHPFARAAAALFTLIALATPAVSQKAFDPRVYQKRLVGEPTQVLVLGSPHLSGTPEGWDPAVLEPLLTRLAAFRPNVITLETLSGQAILAAWQKRHIDPGSARPYGGRVMMLAAAGSAGTGLDMGEAEAEAARMLSGWPATPSPAQRRRLAALFATAGDPYSALVQWWRLDPAERKPGDGVGATLVAQLKEYESRKNEDHLIGSRLASRVGLERVVPADAQEGDAMTPEQVKIYLRELFDPAVKRLQEHPRFGPQMKATQHMNTPEEALAVYRLANDPAIRQIQADIEWGGAIDRRTTQDVGRIRTAMWEVRNLRMVANIRQAMAAHPGGRVLVIVGAGHKLWFEAYLGMMTDVRLVDASTVLR
jgi:hypothetical protein